MKNVLLLAHDDSGQEARFQAALDLTRVLEGHLTCLDVVEVPVLAADCWTRAGHNILVDEAQRQEAANRTRLRKRLEVEDVSWDWKDLSGDIAACVADAAGLADIVIASARVKGFLGSGERDVAADILVKSRTPILAVPDTLKRFDPTSAAIISWDGSDQVMAALHASVPLLAMAEHVTIVEVDDGSVNIPAEEAAAYLSRHGIKAAIQREEWRLVPIATTLFDTARVKRAGLIVMGAFRHWRVSEAVFGGVSRSMLLHSAVPLFMAH